MLLTDTIYRNINWNNNEYDTLIIYHGGVDSLNSYFILNGIKETARVFSYKDETNSIDSCIQINTLDTIIDVWYFKNGGLKRQIKYYTNNIKKGESIFINADSALYYSWYPNGKKENIQLIINPFLNPDTSWYEDGSLRAITLFLKNKIIKRNWYPNGQVMQEDQLNESGRISGLHKNWCSNGVLADSSLFQKGRFKRTRYYCDGKTKDILSYVNEPAFMVGKLEWWYENGVKGLEAYYSNVKNPPAGGIPIGKWTSWNEQGKIIKVEFYDKGNLKSSKIF